MANARKPPARQKAGYHHGDLRRALLDAALAVVSENGVGDLSLREVARRAGVSYAAPYHHFADRSELLAAVATQGFEVLSTELERAGARKGGAKAQFVSMAEAYVTFAVGNASHYRVMFLPELKSVNDAALHQAGDHAFGILVARVAAAKPADNEIAHRTLATAIWSALHGLSLLVADGVLQKMFPAPAKTARLVCAQIVGMAVEEH